MAAAPIDLAATQQLSALEGESAAKRCRTQKQRRDIDAKVDRWINKHIVGKLPHSVIETQRVNNRLLRECVADKYNSGDVKRLQGSYASQLIGLHGANASALRDLKPDNPDDPVSDELIDCLDVGTSIDNKVGSTDNLAVYLQYSRSLNQ